MSFASIKEFEEKANPTAPERKLIAHCRAGTPCVLGKDLPPEILDPSRQIRADLIRLIAIGGTPACGLHPVGIKLKGAQISGTLDLQFTKTRGRCVLDCCRFVDGPLLDHAEFAELSIISSHLPGLSAKYLVVSGCLSLQKSTFTRTVELEGAQIGGEFSCVSTSFDGAGKLALNAQRLRVGDQLSCGRLKTVNGQINLEAAQVRELNDFGAFWPETADCLYLNGFTYDRLSGGASHTFALRKDWLARGSRFKRRFHPQPYTQLAKVLRELGHAAEARKVLMERDRLLFIEAHKANRKPSNSASAVGRGDIIIAGLRCNLLRLWAWFSATISGYGHAPQRALFASLACIGFGAIWFFLAWQAGVMVPNSDIILTSADWSTAMKTAADAPSAEWMKLPSARHYETFYCLPYALDVFVPLVSLGQENAWAITTVTWFGWATRCFSFAYQIAGWAITAMGIAAITGFVQKNQPDS